MELNKLFDTIDHIQNNASVEAVFGPPTQVDEKTIIPIGRVAYGFGLGFGQGIVPPPPSPEPGETTEEDITGGIGGGAGGGLSIRPLAVLEVTPEATIVKPILDEGKMFKMAMCTIAWSVFCLARALVRIFGKR